VPSGDATYSGAMTVDLSSFTAFWNGTNFNQGDAGVVGTVDAAGNYAISWSSLIVGGPFNNFTGSWTATGHVNVVPEAETYAMMLAGLGLLGFAARRTKQQESTA
ncbi:MAG: FxDxF family PEP-CTERM protein, partial [Sulfuritalea sp.]|nr:FxDxF family PEP-CTERM protein [Sulfuritalea sp.]